MEDKDLIIGFHSIKEAILNPQRQAMELFITSKAKDEFFKGNILDNLKVNIVNQHVLQEEGKKIYIRMNKDFKRIPSEMFLIATSLPILNVSTLYDDIKSGKPLKIFCLDQVTDVHNGAAIFRTAAFYGVDYLIVSQKGNFGLSPSFFRMASGGIEHVKLVQCTNLSKTISKIRDLGVSTLGFLESGDTNPVEINGQSICLIMGAEDKGLSNAVKRVVEHKIYLSPKGKLSTLNVSVASAVAMEKFF